MDGVEKGRLRGGSYTLLLSWREIRWGEVHVRLMNYTYRAKDSSVNREWRVRCGCEGRAGKFESEDEGRLDETAMVVLVFASTLVRMLSVYESCTVALVTVKLVEVGTDARTLQHARKI